MKIVSHKEIHKTTWISPDGKSHNQIDRVLIENKHAKLLVVKDVQSYKGADINLDHLLVIMKLGQNVPDATDGKASTRKHLNTVSLKDERKKRGLRKIVVGE